MRIPFEITTKSMKDGNETRDEGLALVALFEVIKNSFGRSMEEDMKEVSV